MATAISLSGFTPSQIKTIKDTVAADTNNTEFDLFMEACRSYGLDPFRKQIHAVVYNKAKADKRKMSIIVSRDGLRILAQRCGDYRPASEPAHIVYDPELKGPLNPKGIASATVRLWKQDRRGEWFPVIGEAHWDEYAPVADEWGEDEKTQKWKPTGRKTLAEGNWTKMPIVMITKCAESQALRAGWPDQFGGVHAEEEMDRVSADVSASEALEEFERADRQARVGGLGLMFVFDPQSMVLEKVPMGSVADRCLDYLQSCSAEDAATFRVRNAATLQDFWAHDKSAALEVKKVLEARQQEFLDNIAKKNESEKIVNMQG